jgi:hypothetical protein
VLLSVQRALLGEITPEMQAVAVAISAAEERDLLVVDAGSPSAVCEAFDASAMTQIVADFCWPERGDPAIALDCREAGPGRPYPLPAGYVLVVARAGASFC